MMSRIQVKVCKSQSATEDVDDTDEGRCVPLNGNSAVDFIVPEARSRDIESAVRLLHDDAIGNELEVFVDLGDILKDLDRKDSYIVTNLISPQLSIVDIVVLVGQVLTDNIVHFLLDEGTDVVKHCLFLLTHFYYSDLYNPNSL